MARRTRKATGSPAKKVRVPRADLGFTIVVQDSKLALKIRIAALEKLLNPSQQFLGRVIRDPSTPGKLRMAASVRLAAIQNPEFGLKSEAAKAPVADNASIIDLDNV